MGTNELHGLCQQFTNYPVKLTLDNGEEYETMIEYVDNEHVHLLYPVDQNEQLMLISQLEGFQSMNDNDYHRYGYGYPPYGYPQAGFGFRPYGWRRWVLPLTALAAIALL